MTLKVHKLFLHYFWFYFYVYIFLNKSILSLDGLWNFEELRKLIIHSILFFRWLSLNKNLKCYLFLNLPLFFLLFEENKLLSFKFCECLLPIDFFFSMDAWAPDRPRHPGPCSIYRPQSALFAWNLGDKFVCYSK